MRHLLVISAVICAVISNGLAQNRGSSRYTPSDGFDEDITRAPRPTRGAAARRQRITTKAPEPAAVEDEVKAYQPADNPVRTTGRRVPQRGSPQQIAPPPPPALPVDNAVPRFAAPADEISSAPPAVPESKPPGTRRRRPKKRRRPQNALPRTAEESEKNIPVVTNEEKVSISDLLNEDKKRNGVFQTNPSSRNSLPTYNSDSVYQAEKSQWENKQSPELQSNSAGSQYYEPQPAVNRLPVADSEPLGNSRGYLESSPAVPLLDAPAPYAPPGAPKDTSYVPILTPLRKPSEGSSRLPLENYPTMQNKDTTRFSSNPNVPLRGHNNRSPISTLEEIPRAKPVLNIIPQSDEPSVPVRSHSEVRLPENQLLTSSPYVPPSFDSSEDSSSPNAKVTEDTKDPASPTNRLPNPSEFHYDSRFPELSSGPQRAAGRRDEQEEPIQRNPLPSYTIPRRDVGVIPHEYDNDAEVDRRQVSQYRPPLQRSSSRFQADDKPMDHSKENINAQSVLPPRIRGSPRYQHSPAEYVSERTRTRSQTEPQTDSPTRSRSSSTSQSSTRTRGSQRFTSETVEPVRRATSRKPSNDEDDVPKSTASTSYIPIEDYIKNEESSEKTLSPNQRPHNQPSSRLTPVKDIYDHTLLRGTLRSQPQFDTRESDPTDRFEESVEEPDIYRPDYYSSPQPNSRPRLNQAAPYPSQPAPQPAYQSPRNRQQNRQESHYESPQNRQQNRQESHYESPQNRQQNRQESHHESPPNRQQNRQESHYESPPNRQQNRQESHYESPPNRQQNRQESHYESPQNYHTRQQPQYQAPQNPRTDSRQANIRQDLPSSRTQSRPRHQSSEPPATAPRSSTGRSNFKCPDAFGFFADPVQCDKYYECRNGTAEMHLCSDGLAFNEASAPQFLRCDSLRDVDCSSRPELQEPQSTTNCPRRFGLFPHETDCTKFWNCVDGTATEVKCPPGLTYSDERATCDWADLVETTCKSEDLLGFTCPDPTAHDLLDGVYARYPHPDNCQLHFTCIKGADGLRRPRMLSCNEGQVFDPVTASCKRPEDVPGCENFYEGRSEAPKKKPARREPEPISEEIIEEPTPRPRRRGPIRRVRS